MAAGLPDLVDCARLAEDAAVLERVYALGELPRLQDLLAEPAGHVARELRICEGGRRVARERASPCARRRSWCVSAACRVSHSRSSGGSEIEFANDEEAAGVGFGARVFSASTAAWCRCASWPRKNYCWRCRSPGVQHAAELRSVRRASPADAARARGVGRDAAAVQRFAGFVEENLIGHSTHGSSKKQKDPLEARHASLAFRARGTRGVDRREERRDSFAPSHFARWILSRPQGACRPRRTRQRPKNKLSTRRRRLDRRSSHRDAHPCRRCSILPSTP